MTTSAVNGTSCDSIFFSFSYHAYISSFRTKLIFVGFHVRYEHFPIPRKRCRTVTSATPSSQSHIRNVKLFNLYIYSSLLSTNLNSQLALSSLLCSLNSDNNFALLSNCRLNLYSLLVRGLNLDCVCCSLLVVLSLNCYSDLLCLVLLNYYSSLLSLNLLCRILNEYLKNSLLRTRLKCYLCRCTCLSLLRYSDLNLLLTLYKSSLSNLLVSRLNSYLLSSICCSYLLNCVSNLCALTGSNYYFVLLELDRLCCLCCSSTLNRYKIDLMAM